MSFFLVTTTYSGPGKGLFKGKKTFQVYLKQKPGNNPYTGHTSGYKTPEKNVANRDYSHHKSKEGFGRAELQKSFDNKLDARKYEQKLVDKHGGSRRGGGTSGNEINAIRKPANKVKID